MILETFVTFVSKIMFFTGYVNNATCFPKPLTVEEEKECIKLFKEGNELAKERLINHNLRLVAHIVKKYSTAGEADDLISVGVIGLIKAINTYKDDKGTQLSTYASRCIENEILMLIRMNKKHNNVFSLEEKLGHDSEGNEITLLETIENEEEDVLESVETKILSEQLVKKMKKLLTPREFKIICMRYGVLGTPALTQREVAKKMGISRSYISRLENKALKIIEKHLNQKDYLG
ncbi:MAG: RNA polymerase subunit sigma-70 [Tenericutes bacterium HGW-Tenericutes-4]|jgi:RNA polymerase sporulation-specific sigma factor|nr:MAG: RNA polymerase subunit sigma-70 [Tenericutes bacterium HGW-Tenericutes-4]